MKKTRKICCQITPRRIMGAVLAAASIVNMVIVGTAYAVSTNAIPTVTATPTVDSLTGTFSAQTATGGIQSVFTFQPVEPVNDTATWTPTATATVSATETATDTPSPTATICTPWYWWPVYIVQGGDTLYRLAILTDTSVEVIMLANCLQDSRIYKGQQLRLPRLPIITETYTPSVTATYTPTGTVASITPSIAPSFTPSYTPVTPTDVPPVLLFKAGP